MADKPAVLDLDTLVVRDVVIISGKRYELKSPAELTILDFYRIGKRANRIKELTEGPDEMSEGAIEEMLSLTDAACKFVLLAPNEVHASLSHHHRLQVLSVFTELQRAANRVGTAEAEAPPTGAK